MSPLPLMSQENQNARQASDSYELAVSMATTSRTPGESMAIMSRALWSMATMSRALSSMVTMSRALCSMTIIIILRSHFSSHALRLWFEASHE